MKLFMILLLLLFNFGIFCYGYNSNRIWNGTAVSPEKYPNIPRLQSIVMKFNETLGFPKTSYGLCTGSIISPRHILTAAHCVFDFEQNETLAWTIPIPAFIVDFDIIDPNFGHHGTETKMLLKQHGIAYKFSSYQGWDVMKANLNDIAIIEFPAGTNLNVTPMALAKNYVEGDADTALSLGYGDDDPRPDVSGTPISLMEGIVPVIKECAWKNINDKIICAGTKTTRTDHGDSGGPLVISRNDALYQIGVVHGGSYVNGSTANQDSDFGIYTRVSAYCDWIEKTTNKEAKCVELPAAAQSSDVELPTTAQYSGGMSYNLIYSLLLLIFIIAF